MGGVEPEESLGGAENAPDITASSASGMGFVLIDCNAPSTVDIVLLI